MNDYQTCRHCGEDIYPDGSLWRNTAFKGRDPQFDCAYPYETLHEPVVDDEVAEGAADAPPCPNCGSPMLGPATGIGHYCPKGFACATAFEKSETLNVPVSRELAVEVEWFLDFIHAGRFPAKDVPAPFLQLAEALMAALKENR